MIKYYWHKGMLYNSDGEELGPYTWTEVANIIANSSLPIQVLRIPPPAR